jgi:hypothetical protein
MALFNDEFYALCPTPSTATTAQPLYFHIDYQVLYQTIAYEIIQHYGAPLGLPLNRPRFSFNSLNALPANVQAAIPVPIWNDLLALSHLGVDGVPKPAQRASFECFFQPHKVRIRIGNLPENGMEIIILSETLLLF